MFKDAVDDDYPYIEKYTEKMVMNEETKKKEPKMIKEKMYPLTFKHDFYKIYRAIKKGDPGYVEHGNVKELAGNKVGFWAPAGNPVSQNQKVVAESKHKKEKDVWETRKRYIDIIVENRFGRTTLTKMKRN